MKVASLRELPLTADYPSKDTQLFAGSLRFVRLLHRFTVYSFKLSTPFVSSLYATWISAAFVPGEGKALVCVNFHWRYNTASHDTQLFVSSLRFVRLLHRFTVYSFILSIPLASSLYATCISATFVPGEGKARVCVNFHWRHNTASQDTH